MEERKRLIAEIHAFLVKAAIMAVTLWVILGVVFGVMPMKDQSMMPKLAAGDLLLYYRLDRTPGDREVVVFEKEGKTYVGRVVARGGDTVEIREDALLQINGNAIVENEEVFILCDYRQGAKDSRYFGPVTKKELKGTVITAIRRSGI